MSDKSKPRDLKLAWTINWRNGSKYYEWTAPCSCAYHPEPAPHIHKCKLHKEHKMTNEDKMNDFQKKLDKIIEEFNALTKHAEPKFKKDDWLEFSDHPDYYIARILQIIDIRLDNSHPFRASDGSLYKYARRPYDRIIPHDGGPTPEWIIGKRATLWFNGWRVQSVCVTEKHSFAYVKEYRVHKENEKY